MTYGLMFIMCDDRDSISVWQMFLLYVFQMLQFIIIPYTDERSIEAVAEVDSRWMVSFDRIVDPANVPLYNLKRKF